MIASGKVSLVANIFISFIGAGVLGLPYAFKEAGLLEGFLVMVFVSVCSVKSMLLLIDCKYKVTNVVLNQQNGITNGQISVRITQGKDYTPLKVYQDEDDIDLDSDEDNGKNKSSASRSNSPNDLIMKEGISYSDVGSAAAGLCGRILADIFIVASQVGFCCGYLIYILEVSDTFWPGVLRTKVLGLILPLLFFLTLIPDLGRLANLSLAAQISNLLAFTVVFWFDFDHLHYVTDLENRTEFDWNGLPGFFSIAIYCFEGAGMILSLEHSCAEHLKSSFKSLFMITIGAVTTLYILFGSAGYLSFGLETQDLIVSNLPHEPGSFNFSLIVKTCLAFALFFTYPIMLFPVTHILGRYFPLTPPGSWLDYSGWAQRFCLVTSSGVLVLLIPGFSDLMKLVGAVCCTSLAFTMPAFCHLTIFGDNLTKSQKFCDIFLMTLGVLGLIVGIATL